MIKILDILSRTLCLLLMIHLLATSISDDYFLKFINKASIEQTIDVEEDTDKDFKNKTLKFGDFNDEYLPNFAYYRTFFLQENLLTSDFQYIQIALPLSNDEILITPPRA